MPFIFLDDLEVILALKEGSGGLAKLRAVLPQMLLCSRFARFSCYFRDRDSTASWLLGWTKLFEEL